MTASWRPGCPVGLAELRLISFTHWDLRGEVQVGEIVVHAEQSQAIAGVFQRLFDARFPLERVRLVDEYGGDDDRSMAANNTSGFNCRRATGSETWSEHAFGLAIDINPIQNPFVTPSGEVLPPEGRAFAGRPSAPGVIQADDVVVAAFAAAGWEWGGAWRNGKDYQHFSENGR